MRPRSRRGRLAAVIAAVGLLAGIGSAVLGVAGRARGRAVVRGRAAPAPGASLDRFAAGSGSGWSRVLPEWPRGLAADDRGAVVLMGHRVAEFELGRGRERWRAGLPAASWLDAPAIDARTVLIATHEELVALDREHGLPRWRAAVGGEPGAIALGPEPGGEPLAIVGTAQGSLRALDARTGAPRWAVTGRGRVYAPPAVGGGLVAATWETGDGDVLRVVDAATGTIRWERSLLIASSAPALAGDLVVVGEGDDDYHARARGFAAADGRERWQRSLPGSFEDVSVPSPSTSSEPGPGDVALMDHFGTVTLLRLADGALRWQVHLAEPVEATRPVVGAHAVVVRSERGSVFALDRATGRVRARTFDGTSLPAGLAAGGGRLLVAWRLTEPGHLDAAPLP